MSLHFNPLEARFGDGASEKVASRMRTADCRVLRWTKSINLTQRDQAWRFGLRGPGLLVLWLTSQLCVVGLLVAFTSAQTNGTGAPAKAVSDPVADSAHGEEDVTTGRSSTDSQPARVDAAPKSATSPDLEGYVIGEQDQLIITVWKEKELSTGVVVRPDGKITVPLVGDVHVVGMTTVELQALLSEKLKPFITVPQVTVAVSQINSRKVYMIGQVAREGTFPLNSSTTILQVIAEAGGLRDFAKRKNIYVLRRTVKGEERYPFNYDAVIRGKKQDQDILLKPGDTIVVP